MLGREVELMAENIYNQNRGNTDEDEVKMGTGAGMTGEENE